MKASSEAHRSWASRPRSRGSGSLVEMSPLSIRFRAKNLIDEPSESRRRRQMTRILNVVVASVGILVTLPLMIAIAVLVRVTSPGPVIYTQPRVGIDRRRERGGCDPNPRRREDRGGKIFTIYKFRTMTAGGQSQVWSSQNDSRITAVGRFLRATRLDELPQFFNVLKGEMNIVGPRPEQPDIFSELHAELGPRYRHRQRVLPGITGLAQVKQGYDTDLEGVRRKVALDLEYIGGRSPRTDLEIMAKTLPVMIFRKVWM